MDVVALQSLTVLLLVAAVTQIWDYFSVQWSEINRRSIRVDNPFKVNRVTEEFPVLSQPQPESSLSVYLCLGHHFSCEWFVTRHKQPNHTWHRASRYRRTLDSAIVDAFWPIKPTQTLFCCDGHSVPSGQGPAGGAGRLCSPQSCRMVWRWIHNKHV